MSHGGEYLIRPSDTLMPTDRLDPIFINSVSPTCQSEHLRHRGLIPRFEEPELLWSCGGNAVSGEDLIATFC